MIEKISNKIKLDLKEVIAFEKACSEIKIDVLCYIETLIDKIEDISEFSKLMVISDTYDSIYEKHKSNPIFDKISFKPCFLKIAGDTINQVLFIHKLK